jgi:hypothetical protein
MSLYIFAKGNKFFRALGNEPITYNGVTGYSVDKAGEETFLPMTEIVFAYAGRKLIRDMVRGTIKIQNPLSWWYALIVVSSNLPEYQNKHSYLSEIIEEIENFNKNISTVPFTERSMKAGQQAAKLMETLWNQLPDDPSIHSLPRFMLLCDLCSENWVFED